MAKRIDSLHVGDEVTLKFNGRGVTTELAIFVKLTGSGEDRRATFRSLDERSNKLFEWDAYRFQGRWSYGTSAERLSLV